MSAIEDLLTDAFHAEAQTVQAESVPPLASGPRSPHRAGSILTARKSLAAAAAAAAVLVVVLAAAVAVPRLMTGSDQAGQPISAATRSALFGATAGTRQPPYFIGAYDVPGSAADVGIYNARTGRMVSHVSPPERGLTFSATAPTGNVLSFIVTAEPGPGHCSTWFYRLTLTAAGGVASLVPLQEVHGEIIPPSGLTASAGGQTVAYTANGCGGGKGWLSVIDLRSRTIKTWQADAEDLWSLSMSADGRLVLYVDSTVYGGDGSVQVLRTSARPGPLSRVARIVVPGGSGVGADGSVAMTPDGNYFFACTEAGAGSPAAHTATVTALAVATGSPLGALHTWSNVHMAPCMVSAVPTGGYLMVSDISPHAIGTRLDLATGQTWQVGGDAGNPPSGVSW